MVTRAHWLPVALLCLTGCLTAPQLKDCIDFELNETAENPACEDRCEVYCAALVDICPDQATNADPIAACRAGCGEFSAGQVRESALSCRFEALREARTNADACESAGIGGGIGCATTPCDQYCGLATNLCRSMYSDFQQCLDICLTFPQTGTSQGGDSVQCRTAQLENGGVDGCNAASIASDGTCGTTCDGYCAQVMTHCVGENAVYPDIESCNAVCALLPQGDFDDWSGLVGRNTLMCRAYHGSLPAKVAPDTHCPHTGVYNEEKCGSICETFCDPLMCGGQFEEIDECVIECARLATEGEAKFPDPAATLQCDM